MLFLIKMVNSGAIFPKFSLASKQEAILRNEPSWKRPTYTLHGVRGLPWLVKGSLQRDPREPLPVCIDNGNLDESKVLIQWEADTAAQ